MLVASGHKRNSTSHIKQQSTVQIVTRLGPDAAGGRPRRAIKTGLHGKAHGPQVLKM